MELKDQLRDFENKVSMQGPLTELEVRRGKNEKTGNEWLRIKGAIKFGEHAIEAKRFDTGIITRHKKTAEGQLDTADKPAYTRMNDFATQAKIAFDATPERGAPIVSLLGSFVTNIYMNSKNDLVETVTIRPGYLRLSPEIYDGPSAAPTVEGMIYSIAPETAGEEKHETGRLRVTLLTVDYFKNLVPIKNIIVTAENCEYFEDHYEKGMTAKLYLEWVPKVDEAAVPATGGFGKKRTTGGKSYLELVCVGADAPLDDDNKNAFAPAVAKVLMQEYKQKVEEIKEAGYQGSTQSTSAASRTTTPASVVKARATSAAFSDDDDDEMPF
jgi:hypothetical protein